MGNLQTRVKNLSDDEMRHKYNELLSRHNSLEEERMLEVSELQAAMNAKDKDLDELWTLVNKARLEMETREAENVSSSLGTIVWILHMDTTHCMELV